MYPELLRLGSFHLSTYGLALAIAFLVTIGLASQATTQARGRLGPLTSTELVDWGCWGMLGGIVGGRLLYVILNWDSYAATPLEIFALWHGGLIWYGGFAGGLLAHAWYVQAHHHSVLASADQVIPFVALGHAIGRLGCFANGCCAGKPSGGWCAVQFPGQPHPVIATQLLESASLVGLFLGLRALQRASVLRRPGRLLGCYLLGYAVIRWILEVWRANQPLLWDNWTIYQRISAVIQISGLVLILVAKERSHGADVSVCRRAPRG